MLGSSNPQYLSGLEEFRTYQWLHQKYWVEELSLSQIANLVGVNFGTIKKWMVKVGIPRRSDGARKGKFNHNFKGSCLTIQGYKLIYSPEHPNRDNRNYVREHILVAEKILGRYLVKGEIIHHINEDVSDNRPENLYLMPKRKHDAYHQMKRKKSIRFEPITQSNLSRNG